MKPTNALGKFACCFAIIAFGPGVSAHAHETDHDAKAGNVGGKANPRGSGANRSTAYKPKGTIAGEPLDEAMSGRTLNGTPVSQRTMECFPAEPRDLFWKMDWVANKDGQLVPLDFDEDGDGVVSDEDRDAIRGRNTWLLWGGGNEVFWNWLQEKAYGLTDYLVLMDSRQRANRFKSAGIINQPGFEMSTKPLLGLYLDQPKGGDWRNAMLRPPPARDANNNLVVTPFEAAGYERTEPERYDAQGRKLEKPVYRPRPPPNHATELFEPWTTLEEWEKQGVRDESFRDYIPEVLRRKLPQDGLDVNIYGYPSGIFGLRLMLNPDFFAKTQQAAEARTYWKQRVEQTNGRYYTETSIHSDPNLIRPFRVTMSCGFCHVAQHPLNPPLRADEPEWENLSSIIGAQYWDPQPANGNLLKRRNFLHHFLKSQAPGTIDTSLVSTDQINNTNVINPIFDVPARLARALDKPTELQSADNLRLPSLEDPDTSMNPDATIRQRHFPMVLGPGEDSVGIFGALERVPHNVGVFSEYWFTTGNLVLGFTPQRPFTLKVGKANSVYWNTNVQYRVPYMAAFFELGHKLKVPKSTAPMKLKYAGPHDANGRPALDPTGQLQPMPGALELAKDADEKRNVGRKVFLDNCAICHSSKLPKGFDLRFSRTISTSWDNAPAPASGTPPIYTLPMEYSQWEAFRSSPAMKHFQARMAELAGPAPAPEVDDPFLTNNFLSNELRIPITLTGTYSGRAMATNAMRGNVWDNYSSETFKELPSVHQIRYFNPYKADPSAVKFDPYGTNDEYSDGREKGGPGYFRPATLISVWASAPFFHNNALGIYTQDPSVEGRLVAFDDAIRKLLWNSQRPGYTRGGRTYVPPGDLRAEGSPSAANDPGYIYRLPVDTRLQFQPAFIPYLVKGVLNGLLGRTVGAIVFSILSFWLWVLLTFVFGYLASKGTAKGAGVLLLFLGVALAAVLALTGLGGRSASMVGTMATAATNLLQYATAWLWLIVVALLAGGIALMLARREWRGLARAIFVITTTVTLFLGILTNKYLNGRLKQVNPIVAVLPNSWLNAEYKGIDIGPIPRGTPVNLLMNLDPTKTDKVPGAVIALVKAMVQINKQHLEGDAAYQVFSEVAGPALMAASKVPDFVLDRGHWFGEGLADEEKEALIAFLKTL